MKRKLSLILLLTLLLSLLLLPAHAAEEKAYLVDQAGVLSEAEASELSALLAKKSKACGADLIVVTAFGTDGQSLEAYADDFMDDHNYASDAVLLLVDASTGQRWISTGGDCVKVFDDDAFDELVGEIRPALDAEDYAAGFRAFAGSACDIIEDANRFPFGLLLASLVLGALLAWIIPMKYLKGQLKSVRPQASAQGYVRSGSLNLSQSRDLFLYRNVVATPKPKSNSSSGGSGTHTSSSGRTHGGRGF